MNVHISGRKAGDGPAEESPGPDRRGGHSQNSTARSWDVHLDSDGTEKPPLHGLFLGPSSDGTRGEQAGRKMS